MDVVKDGVMLVSVRVGKNASQVKSPLPVRNLTELDINMSHSNLIL